MSSVRPALTFGGLLRLMELKEMCEDVLCKETNIETVLTMLVIADRHQAEKLKDMCVKFLVENCHTVVKQPGWREMLEPYPALLAGQNFLAGILQ